jgi:hypothetical protein
VSAGSEAAAAWASISITARTMMSRCFVAPIAAHRSPG